ncbi:MAG: DegT/DnrJ/EryC1/StrS family aminotransferase [Chitinophagales bacterium]|nr:DegT/DnrJ/EryC1/StrS family aminotransferase [Chitinophagales bacterium]
MINVTKSYLPDRKEYEKYLEGIWERGWLTNHGPLVTELEQKLREFLGVKHCFFVNNGTIAIQIAIRALDLQQEVITTPFSYVATVSSLVWEKCSPVFADIEKDYLTLDPAAIEKLITPETTGIVATHVYGNPCNVEAIDALAKKHGLKVIYDAAHAFGVGYKGKNVLNYGDISTLSFHATKLFHTVEGGAVVTNDDELAFRISYMRNFGHNGPEKFFGVGVNGKSSEFHAAMGLCVLPAVPDIMKRRKEICSLYDQLLDKSLEFFHQRPDTTYNYAYYPILFPSESDLLKAVKALNDNQIVPRRYFYPSLNTLDYVQYMECPVSEDISKRVLCLPLFVELKDEQVRQICSLVNKSLNT